MRILLVEDETVAAEVLAGGLREEGYAVDVAPNGEEAEFKVFVNQYDLVVLDVAVPRKNGFQVCRDLRAKGFIAPILFLTARDGVEERIRGLDMGADDYMVKPYEYRELLSRIRRLLRRSARRECEVLTVEDLRIEVPTHHVERAGKTVELTAKEFVLLEYLARNAGKPVTRNQISRHVWDESYEAFSNLIETYVARLRRKIDAGHPVALLQTRRGEGYILGPKC
jgi:DNA-binding response OmpR family regulator